MKWITYNRNLFLAILLIISTGILLYSNILHANFVFDDHNTIIRNPHIKTLDLNTIWQQRPSRFLTNLSFALNYHIGKLDTFPYHLTNVFIHMVNGILVFILVYLLWNIDKNKNKNIIAVLLIASLIFVVHPIQTEAVSFITQRYASLVTLFYLLSLILYIKYCTSGKQRFYFFSLIIAALSFFTKENSFTLPAVLILLHLYFFRKKVSIKKIFIHSLPFFLVAILTYFLTFTISAGVNMSNIEKTTSMVRTLQISRGEYLLTQTNVIATYIRLLFFPVNQNIDYDFPISKSLFEVNTIFSFLFIIVILTFAIWLRKKNKMASFGILFFFLTLSIESSFIPIEDVIFEHRLYLPMMGFVIFLTSLLKNKTHYLVAIILIAALSFMTYQRNNVWQNDLELWSDAVKKSPAKVRPHYNLGVVSADLGWFDDAKVEFEKTVKLDSGYTPALHNLGALYEKEKNFPQAEKYYLMAKNSDSHDIRIYQSLGLLYIKLKETDKAIEVFESILALDPQNVSAQKYLELLRKI